MTNPLKGRYFVYQDEKGEISVWTRPYHWHKYLAQTPKAYADAQARLAQRLPNYEPCFWGMGSDFPEEIGYRYMGEIL